MRRSTATAIQSGRFLLRVRPHVHARLQAEARHRDLSLNEYCARRLSVPGPAALIDEAAGAAVDRALAQFSEKLVGVILFGSHARGDAASASDVDILVVVDSSIPLSRDLYRQWDAKTRGRASARIDPHFVRLLADVRTMPGAWCEAAIDGVVLFERDGAVTRHLAAVRGDIASGRLMRRLVHGQPYWTVAA